MGLEGSCNPTVKEHSYILCVDGPMENLEIEKTKRQYHCTDQGCSPRDKIFNSGPVIVINSCS